MMRNIIIDVLLVVVVGLTASFSSSVWAHENLEIVLSQIVFRHGDRTPVTIYPNDPNGESFWKKYGGLGQLTQIGMKQHFEFGEYLRKRYKEFLSKTYDRNQVIVKSTNYDRTMMSAQSLLSGLYKPEEYQIWNPDILWQPIPVRTADLDSLFIPKCARYDQLLNEVFSSDEFQQYNSKYKDLIDVATKKTNMKNLSLQNLWQIADTSAIEKSYDLPLPDWVVENYDLLMMSRDEDFFFKYRTEEMSKLTTGGILNEMRSNIKAALKGNSSLQLALFSAHDTYIAALVRLFGLSNFMPAPPYVSSFILELHKSKKGPEYYVLAYLKNNTASSPIDPKLMQIAGCKGNMCPLEDFMRIIADKVVENPTIACAKRPPTISPMSLITNLSFIIPISFALFCSLLVSFCAIKTVRRMLRLRSGYRQQEL